MKKHKITKLRLGEISAVDKPAQPGATALLMKRAGDTPEPDASTAPKETEMFKTRAELLAAIAKALENPAAVTDADRDNINKSATALNMVGDVPVSVSKAAPATVTTDQALIARVEKAEKISGLSAVHKAHYDTLTTDADRDAFLAKSGDARTADIAKAAGPDPVVYTTLDGTDIHKSAGDLVLRLAKQADTNARELAVEKATRVDADLTKRAETDIGKMAGDLDTRKALLKAVDGISDTKVRAEVLKSLEAANKAMGGAFTRSGSTAPADLNKSEGGEVELTKKEAEDKLDELAKALQKADSKLAYHEAYEKALESEEGRKLYKAAYA